MIDGQYGSLIVRNPPESNPHYGLYDEDLPEHVITISDWMHELSLERFPGRYRSKPGQIPDNFLINGRGNWTVRKISVRWKHGKITVRKFERIIIYCSTKSSHR